MGRFKPLVLVGVVLLAALLVASCEKERPVPAAGLTVAPGRGVSLATATRLPPLVGGDAQSARATPLPLNAATLTPMPPGSLPSVPNVQNNTATGGGYFLYKVVAGDNLMAVAKRFGVTVDQIVKLNILANPDALTVGQEIKIPGQPGQGGASTETRQTTQSAGSSQAAAGGTSYTVAKGDTLMSIARRFGTTPAVLQQLNGIKNPDMLSIGQTLKLPGAATGGSGASQPATGQGKTYVVQKGDTLSKIASRFGVTMKAIQTANNITNPDRISPGQVLTIP